MTNSVRVILAQLNFLVGDIQGNAEKIIANAIKARDELKADLIVFPELALTGYPPEDLILRPGFHNRIRTAINQISEQVKDIHIVIGHPHSDEKNIFNAASVIHNGQVISRYYKQILPNYSVFDEKRYFEAGTGARVFTVNDIPFGLTICEDIWWPGPITSAKQAGAKALLCLNASPYHVNRPAERIQALKERLQEEQMPIFYINTVGGQDELVFDGGSLVVDAGGHVIQQGELYEEELLNIELKQNKAITVGPTKINKELGYEQAIYDALVLGTKEYVKKTGFKGAIIGLSGGIDSALTLAIAVDALGKENVEVVQMPSRYTAQMSIDDAVEEAETLGVEHSIISIEQPFKAFLEATKDEFAGMPVDTTEENMQARCRGIILMAISNKKGKIVLTTGNKSEMSVGYATLYGDMAGGFAVIKDVSKTLVYQLANYRNTISPAIPQRVIDRPPSAELAEDQTDQDSLPPYDILDPILERYIEKDQSIKVIVEAGFDKDTVERVARMVDRNEYKRRQSPPGVRITQRAFGRDRRYPIASGFKS